MDHSRDRSIAVLGAVVAGCGGDDEWLEQRSGLSNLSGIVVPSGIAEGPRRQADYLIASDLPLQGASRPQTEQMGKAIEFILNQRGFKAGDKNDRLPGM